jgi:hypothetical protein
MMIEGTVHMPGTYSIAVMRNKTGSCSVERTANQEA